MPGRGAVPGGSSKRGVLVRGLTRQRAEQQRADNAAAAAAEGQEPRTSSKNPEAALEKDLQRIGRTKLAATKPRRARKPRRKRTWSDDHYNKAAPSDKDVPEVLELPCADSEHWARVCNALARPINSVEELAAVLGQIAGGKPPTLAGLEASLSGAGGGEPCETNFFQLILPSIIQAALSCLTL